MYKLYYLKKSQTGICVDDFKNAKEVDTINLKFLLSLSDLQKFETPLSGRYVGKFALVTMSNNDKYYIDENSFTDLSEALSYEDEITKLKIENEKLKLRLSVFSNISCKCNKLYIAKGTVDKLLCEECGREFKLQDYD